MGSGSGSVVNERRSLAFASWVWARIPRGCTDSPSCWTAKRCRSRRWTGAAGAAGAAAPAPTILETILASIRERIRAPSSRLPSWASCTWPRCCCCGSSDSCPCSLYGKDLKKNPELFRIFRITIAQLLGFLQDLLELLIGILVKDPLIGFPLNSSEKYTFKQDF